VVRPRTSIGESNWRDVGGADRSIVVVTAQPGDGVPSMVEIKLLMDRGLTKDAGAMTGVLQIAKVVAQLPGALGLVTAKNIDSSIVELRGEAITQPLILGCLNRISALISGASAEVRLPSGGAAVCIRLESRRQVQNLVPIGVRPRADALATLFSDLRGHAAKVFDLAANFVQDQATDALNGPFAETAKRIDAELQTILKSMRVNAQAEADELVDARVSLLQEIAAVSSMALAALLGFGVLLTRSISGRLRRITAAMTAISGGTRTGIEIPSTQDRDEVGEMARSLEVSNLNVMARWFDSRMRSRQV
jgi:methyl-accepting chemotaxis protein